MSVRHIPNNLIGIPHIIIADADESIANDTLQNDDIFFFPVLPNEIYIFQMLVIFTTGASDTPDFKKSWTLPAGATITDMNYGLQTGATNLTQLAQSGRYQSTTAAGWGCLSSATQANGCHLVFWGTIRIGATGGVVQFQWAQNTTTGGTPTVRKADSWLQYTRVR